MVLRGAPRRQSRRVFVLLACALASLLVAPGAAVDGRQAKVSVLRIGTSGSLAMDTSSQKEEAALQTLKAFIKEETGLENEILRQKDWQELVDKMAKGDLHLGVLQGYEYAWAQEKHPDLKPLALAVNVHTYPVAYVVTNRNNKAGSFADLQGQSLSIPGTGQHYLRLFVERQSQAAGKKLEEFFAKVTTPDNAEDALDDVVDGVVQATVVDQAALEAFKRRKPGRFKNIKEVARSKPFPPPLVAYYGKTLDEATRERFRTTLLNANRKEKGETVLTLFRLTGFVAVPDDFDKVVAETRKAYPPPDAKPK
jgi:ABC-type phosphate/phosphonate transport system substrate-binding protein